MVPVLARLKFLAIWKHYLETLLSVSFNSSFARTENPPKTDLVTILSPL